MSSTNVLKKFLVSMLIVSVMATVFPYNIVSAGEGNWIYSYQSTYYRAEGCTDNTVETVHGRVLTG